MTNRKNKELFVNFFAIKKIMKKSLQYEVCGKQTSLLFLSIIFIRFSYMFFHFYSIIGDITKEVFQNERKIFDS